MRLQVLRALPSHNLAKIDHAAEATSVLASDRGLLPLVENAECRPPNGPTVHPQGASTRERTGGAPLAATEEKL